MHYGSDPREEFCRQAETLGFSFDPDWHRLTGKLWCCTDIMPSTACDDLDMPHGTNYAQACHQLRRYWRYLAGGNEQ